MSNPILTNDEIMKRRWYREWMRGEFGSKIQVKQDLLQTGAADDTWVDKLTFTTPIIRGTFIVEAVGSFERSATGPAEARLYSVTDVATLADSYESLLSLQAKLPVLLRAILDFNNESREFKFQFRRPSGGGTVYLSDAILSLWRIE